MHFEYFDRYLLAKTFIKEEQPDISNNNIGYVIKRNGKYLVSLSSGRGKNSLWNMDNVSEVSEGRKFPKEIIYGWAVLVN